MLVDGAGHDGLRIVQQRESFRNDELRRQQRHQRRAADRVRLVPADRHVSISGRRHRLLLRGRDARALGQHEAARAHDAVHRSTHRRHRVSCRSTAINHLPQSRHGHGQVGMGAGRHFHPQNYSGFYDRPLCNRADHYIFIL